MAYLVSFLFYTFMVCMLTVASNPAPYYAALGLVVTSGVSCAILSVYGTPFLALVLFLVYLGGMLVVFGYSAALAADAHPESWADQQVYEQGMFFLVGLIVSAMYAGPPAYKYIVGVSTAVKEFLVVRVDIGVIVLYSVGGALMLFCAWVLLLTLFVVLELTRGLARGALRAP